MKPTQTSRRLLVLLGLLPVLVTWFLSDRPAPRSAPAVPSVPPATEKKNRSDTLSTEQDTRAPAALATTPSPVSSLNHELAFRSTTTAHFAGEEHVFRTELSGLLEIECSANLPGAIEATVSLKESELSLPVSSVPGFEELIADVRAGLAQPWPVRLDDTGASMLMADDVGQARRMAADLLAQVLDIVPLAPAGTQPGALQIERRDALGRYTLALREVAGEKHGAFEHEKLRYLSHPEGLALEVEVLASRIRGERDASHGWTRTVQAEERLAMYYGEDAMSERCVEVKLTLLEVEDAGAERLLASSGQDRRTAILQRLAQLAAVLEDTDPALFTAMEELSQLFREDSESLARTISDLRVGDLGEKLTRLTLQAMGRARVPQASAFLVEHAENMQISDDERQATLHALVSVRPDEDLLRVLDPAAGLGPVQRKSLLLALLVPEDSNGEQLLDMESAAVAAGLGVQWLEALAASRTPADPLRIGNYLEHPDARMRSEACEALVSTGGAEGLRLLVSRLAGEEDGNVRRVALRSLAASSAALDLVAASLHSEPDGEIRAQAVVALAEAPGAGKAKIELLRELAVTDMDADVREAAGRALGL